MSDPDDWITCPECGSESAFLDIDRHYSPDRRPHKTVWLRCYDCETFTQARG